MVRGRVRRRVDALLIAASTLLLLGAAGPSLLLADLDVHVVLGIALSISTAGHLWLHRTSVLAWLPSHGGAPKRATVRRRLVRTQDAGRELAFAVTVLTGAALLAGGAGETLHLFAGFALLALAATHAVRHRDWFARRLRRGRVVSRPADARP